jgi:SAM-dependent methyltransferase
MSNWVLIVIIILVSLFAIKMIIAVSIVSVLRITQGAMFHPSAKIRVKTFLDATAMRPDELLIDVGCGDGRVLKEARKRYGVKALGYEVNPMAYVLARLRNIFTRNVEIRFKNFWKENISSADVVFCYLFPDVMQRLAHKLEQELHPGARVVSCNFRLPGWMHHTELNPDSFFHSGPIFCYRFPDACAGHLQTPKDSTMSSPASF